jgi:phospholipase/carboxylesterase
VSEAPVEVNTCVTPTGTVIWMHGLGADGHDFEPIVPELLLRQQQLPLRFIFPHAPVRPVTINGGYAMRAWFDVLSFDRDSKADWPGIRASEATITALIEREHQRGIASQRIVLAGFSQGGAMALHAGTRFREALAGIMVLSGYRLASDPATVAASAANLRTPIFLAHGTHDAVLPLALGEQSRLALANDGHEVEWHSYAMEHSLCAEEVSDIADFLARAYAA